MLELCYFAKQCNCEFHSAKPFRANVYKYLCRVKNMDVLVSVGICLLYGMVSDFIHSDEQQTIHNFHPFS